MIKENQFVKVKWNSKNKAHYSSLGYIWTKKGEEFLVDVQDLTHGSKIYIEIICDYCGEEFLKLYNNYAKGRLIIQKDACEKCSVIKKEEAILEKYKTNSIIEIMNLKYGQEKTEQWKQNFIDNNRHLGFTKESRLKSKQTMLERYGVEHPIQNDLIKNKISHTKYVNGNQILSKQQKYINRFINGEVNYQVDNYFLDIAIPEKKIYIEYDGGGHDLSVKLGNLSEEEFKNREICRTNKLYSLGWRCIRIISKKDLLPKDKILNDLILNATKKLENNIYVKTIIIDFGVNIENNNFGRLRRISKKDVKEVTNDK